MWPLGRVHVINQDAHQFVQNSKQFYDAIIVDLPDPKSVSLSLLYSVGFYKMVIKLCIRCADFCIRANKHLKPFGVLVTQSTSPLYSPKAFLCIKKSMEAGGFSVVPYQNSIPTMQSVGGTLSQDPSRNGVGTWESRRKPCRRTNSEKTS